MSLNQVTEQASKCLKFEKGTVYVFSSDRVDKTLVKNKVLTVYTWGDGSERTKWHNTTESCIVECYPRCLGRIEDGQEDAVLSFFPLWADDGAYAKFYRDGDMKVIRKNASTQAVAGSYMIDFDDALVTSENALPASCTVEHTLNFTKGSLIVYRDSFVESAGGLIKGKVLVTMKHGFNMARRYSWHASPQTALVANFPGVLGDVLPEQEAVATALFGAEHELLLS